MLLPESAIANFILRMTDRLENQSVQGHLGTSTSYLWKIADTSTTFGTWKKFAQCKNEMRWSTLISLSIWLTTMVIYVTDNKPASLIESRLAALVAPARYHLHLDRAIFQLQLQLPPLPDEIITTRCTKFYERLKFPWSHVNQSISLFNICQRKRQLPRRRYFFTMKMKPLIAEEITICAIKKIFLIPAPVSMIQIDSTSCNVTYVFDRKFTVSSNGYDFCCVFKIVGTEYFWRSPDCTKRRLVSCVTGASSHVAGAI